MTPKAEEYRAKALECEERAAYKLDCYIKEQLLEIAAQWRQWLMKRNTQQGGVAQRGQSELFYPDAHFN